MLRHNVNGRFGTDLLSCAPGLADLAKTNDKRSGLGYIALDSFAEVDCVDCVE
jgi:hypothetical protein